MMVEYNPREITDIPKVGVLKAGIPQVPFLNAFGPIDRSEYEIVETEEPYLLWEDGSAMSWEDGKNILLEQQLVRIWLRKGRR